MVRKWCGLAIVVLAAIPPSAHGQLPGVGLGGIGGLGAGGGGQQLGPPPAGVLLHQQYMQLYGLPVNFQQNTQLYNNNQSGGGGYGGYPGGGYPGGYPGFNGINYQRQLAAMRAAQTYGGTAGYYGNNYTAAYNATSNGSATSSTAKPAAGFGMGNSYAPSFLTTATPSMAAANGFGGFGLNTISPSTEPTKSEESKDDSKTKSGDAKPK